MARELGKLVVPVLSTPPSTPALGQIYFDQDAGDLQLYVWDGTIWDGLVTTNTAQTIGGQKNFSSQVLLPTTGTTGGILFGTDALLYRGAADTLYTGVGDSLYVQDKLSVGGGAVPAVNMTARFNRTKGDDGSTIQYLGLLADPTWQPTNDLTPGIHGIRSLVHLDDSLATGNPTGTMQAMSAVANLLTGTRTWSEVRGITASLSTAAGASPLTSGFGVRISHAVASTINQLYGLYIDAISASATVTANYGLRIENMGTTGVGTAVGLHIDAQSAATTANWAMRIAGGQSYHVGNLRIGSTTAPTVPLDVTGAAKFSSTADVTGVLSALAGGKTALTIADSGAQLSGLTIGGDTNLYRSVTNILKTDDRLVAVDGLTTKTTAGTTTDGAFTATPADGTIAVDTTNNLFYFRSGGTWRGTSGSSYATTIGDGSTVDFTVTHNLGTKDVSVLVYDTVSGAQVYPTVYNTSTSQILLRFSGAPTSNQYRVVVSGTQATRIGAGSASVPFTDGDTIRRVTVTDSNVTTTSKIIGMIRRPDTTDDSQDPGYLYVTNIVKIANGSFDLFVGVQDWDGGDVTLAPPNETVQFVYWIS